MKIKRETANNAENPPREVSFAEEHTGKFFLRMNARRPNPESGAGTPMPV
jgi:hypothetical protein